MFKKLFTSVLFIHLTNIIFFSCVIYFSPAESSAMLNLKSAVKSLEELKLLYTYRYASLAIIGMSEADDVLDSLRHHLDLLRKILY